ncbi:hypothetical protein ACJJTC_019603 [Scirpophaga incertulas]
MNTCAMYKKERIPCPPVCFQNSCECKKGFVYDDNTRKCVKPENCTPTCQENEEYSSCANGVCRFVSCTQYGQPTMFCPKFDKTKCKGGCICKKTYLRNSDGVCVPKEECPQAVCKSKKNEIYNECTNGGCSARNCSQLGYPTPCIKMDPKYCIKGCICEEGYLRDDTGTCVPKENCPQTCGSNEILSNCTNGVCGPKNCNELGYQRPCEEIDPVTCMKGCICIEGYVRDDKEECILKTSCPSCGGDPNAVSSKCGNDCKNTCAMFQIAIALLSFCFENSCSCKTDYIYDGNTQKCVHPEECTPMCKQNETYNSCANGLCRFEFCTQYGQPPMFCSKFDKKNCKGDCVCQDNYLRNSDGVCIPKEDCPQARCKREKHELYSDCINSGCIARNCSQLGYPVPCPKVDASTCIKGCVCEEGYLKDDNGDCVSEEKCRM